MGIFDNATSVSIDGNTVESIVIDGGTVYESSSEPTVRDVSFKAIYMGEPVSNGKLRIFTHDGQTLVLEKALGSQGGCTAQLADGQYSCTVQDSISTPIGGEVFTVDADHISFEWTFQ